MKPGLRVLLAGMQAKSSAVTRRHEDGSSQRGFYPETLDGQMDSNTNTRLLTNRHSLLFKMIPGVSFQGLPLLSVSTLVCGASSVGLHPLDF